MNIEALSKAGIKCQEYLDQNGIEHTWEIKDNQVIFTFLKRDNIDIISMKNDLNNLSDCEVKCLEVENFYVYRMPRVFSH